MTSNGHSVFHYTSRHAAQRIEISGRLVPGRSGVVYLTDQDYNPGWRAAKYLAIADKPVEVVLGLLYDLGGLVATDVERLESLDGVVLEVGGESMQCEGRLTSSGIAGRAWRCHDVCAS